MVMMPTYRAVLHDPTLPRQIPDKHGTHYIPAEASCVSTSFKSVAEWGEHQLKTAGEGSTVDVFMTQQVFVKTIVKRKENATANQG